jgi:hypothetical protein
MAQPRVEGYELVLQPSFDELLVGCDAPERVLSALEGHR